MAADRLFPDLILPRVRLADLPTPAMHMARLGHALGLRSLWFKRDDLTSRLYGGNKVRKLEFLLGAARERNALGIVAIGAAGSNHVAATACHALSVGLPVTALLLDQPNAAYVRHNLKLGLAWGARQIRCRSHAELTWRLAGLRLEHPDHAFIPLGGSSPVGAVGYVAAGLELVAQIATGELPEPAAIFVPTGSLGTQAGLLLGLALAGRSIPIWGVPIMAHPLPWDWLIARLFRSTAELLARSGQAPPPEGRGIPRLERRDVHLVKGHMGPGYAHFTEEGMRILRLAADLEGLKLDGTYTAKALCGAVAAAHELGLADKPILFWHTLSSSDTASVAADVAPDTLPPDFRHYFDTPVQPLDPDGA